MWRVNEDIVHVDGDITFVNQLSKDEVHHGLKGSRGIRKAKKHDHGFKQAAIGFEHCLPLVTISNMYVVVSPSDVQLRKECRSATVHSRESIHKFSYQWERGGVSYSDCVEFLVVLYRAEVTVLLLDKKEWERVWGL